MSVERVRPVWGPSRRSSLDSPARRSRTRAVLAFLCAAGSFYYLNFGGQLYVMELILAVGVLLSIPGSKRPTLGAGLAIGMVLWGFGSLLSDILAESDTLTLVKGLLRVLFLAVDIFALYYICDRDLSAVRALWAGLAVAGLLAVVIQPSAATQGQLWKFGVGLPITLLVILLLTRKERATWFSVGVLLALAGAHFVFGFRSMASVAIIAALLLAVRVSRRPREGSSTGARPLRWRPAVVAVVGVGSVLTLTAIYDSLAARGVFGFIAQQKAAYQADGEFGSSLSSRSEFLLSVQSIGDNPLFGGGSYSVASIEVANSAATWLNGLGYSEVAQRLVRGAPAFHSELLGMWAENGILSLFFWLPVAALLVRAIYAVVYRTTHLPELIVFISVLGLWDLVFSPFGADRRMWLAATIVSIVVAAIPKKE